MGDKLRLPTVEPTFTSDREVWRVSWQEALSTLDAAVGGNNLDARMEFEWEETQRPWRVGPRAALVLVRTLNALDKILGILTHHYQDSNLDALARIAMEGLGRAPHPSMGQGHDAPSLSPRLRREEFEALEAVREMARAHREVEQLLRREFDGGRVMRATDRLMAAGRALIGSEPESG